MGFSIEELHQVRLTCIVNNSKVKYTLHQYSVFGFFLHSLVIAFVHVDVWGRGSDRLCRKLPPVLSFDLEPAGHHLPGAHDLRPPALQPRRLQDQVAVRDGSRVHDLLAARLHHPAAQHLHGAQGDRPEAADARPHGTLAYTSLYTVCTTLLSCIAVYCSIPIRSIAPCTIIGTLTCVEERSA